MKYPIFLLFGFILCFLGACAPDVGTPVNSTHTPISTFSGSSPNSQAVATKTSIPVKSRLPSTPTATASPSSRSLPTPSATIQEQLTNPTVLPATAIPSDIDATAEPNLYRDPLGLAISDLSERLVLPSDEIYLIRQSPIEVRVGNPCGLSKTDETRPMPQGTVIGYEILLEAKQERYRYIVQGGRIHFCG